MASTPSRPCDRSLTGSQARVTVSDVRVQKDLTYADLDVLLAAVPAAPSKTKTVAMAQWTSSGFLAAAASLMEEGRTAAGNASKAPHFVRTYPYNGQLYELQLRSADHVDRHTREGRSFGPAIRGRFRVLNRTTGEETPFTVVYGVEGDLTGVPLLISWRPRWWLEIECALRDDVTRITDTAAISIGAVSGRLDTLTIPACPCVRTHTPFVDAHLLAWHGDRASLRARKRLLHHGIVDIVGTSASGGIALEATPDEWRA